ncbi:hypothetical protein SLA2020_040400 [Shorea laevis]
MQGRIPAKENMKKRVRSTDPGDSLCPFCGEHPETTKHLLLSCRTAWTIWTTCYNWWGIQTASQRGGCEHLLQHIGMESNGLKREACTMVWFATIWTVWSAEQEDFQRS